MLYINSFRGKGRVIVGKKDADGWPSLAAAVSAAEDRINRDESIDQVTISEKAGKRVAVIDRDAKGGPPKKTLLR